MHNLIFKSYYSTTEKNIHNCSLKCFEHKYDVLDILSLVKKLDVFKVLFFLPNIMLRHSWLTPKILDAKLTCPSLLGSDMIFIFLCKTDAFYTPAYEVGRIYCFPSPSQLGILSVHRLLDLLKHNPKEKHLWSCLIQGK